MVSIEQLGIPEFLITKDAGVEGVALCVPLKRGGMEDIGEVEVFLSRDIGQISFALVNSLSQAQFTKVFLENVEKDSCEQNAKTHIHPKLAVHFQLSFSQCCPSPYEGKRKATPYLKVVADFHVDFGQRDGNSGLLHLAHPGVQLLAGQQLLNPLQWLHVVGHDEDHAGLLMGQRHAQHK